MDKYYEDLLIKFIKSSDEPINSNEYKKFDLFILRKEIFLNLRKLDIYFQMELSQNKKLIYLHAHYVDPTILKNMAIMRTLQKNF